MSNQDKQILIGGIRKLSAVLADLAAMLESSEDHEQMPSAPPEETPAKIYTYEEVRSILADKVRAGFREQVKAILTAHGVKQLSDVKTPEEFAAIVTDAGKIENG